MSKRLPALFLTTALAGLPLGAAAQDVALDEESRTALTLTLYQQGFGLVHDQRRAALNAGETVLVLENMTDQIDATSLRVFGPEGLRLMEQSRLYPTLNPQELLERYLGKQVLLIRTVPETGEEIVEEAKLIALAGGPILERNGRIEINPAGRIALPELPEGLRAEPALKLRLAAPSAGETDLTFAYLSQGLGWQASYVASLSESGDSLDLTAYVSLRNDSGQDFENAGLRLVAGDVNKAAPRLRRQDTVMMEQAMGAMAPMQAEPDFGAAQGVGDRYLYNLERPVDLMAGEEKQVSLLSAEDIPAERLYRFDGNLISPYGGSEEIGPLNAAIMLEFENAEAGGLGRPLPAGSLRVYEAQPGGVEVFGGEDWIDHTAVGGEVSLYLGDAFDVTGSAKLTLYKQLSQRAYESGQEITVKNAKDEPVTVEIYGHMPRGWKMLEESLEHEEESANRLLWRLDVPAKGEASFSYEVRVTAR